MYIFTLKRKLLSTVLGLILINFPNCRSATTNTFLVLKEHGIPLSFHGMDSQYLIQYPAINNKHMSNTQILGEHTV